MQPNPISETSTDLALLRLPQVKAQTGLSRSELYRRIAVGSVPSPIKIGERASTWSSVDRTLDHRTHRSARCEKGGVNTRSKVRELRSGVPTRIPTIHWILACAGAPIR